MTLSPSLYSLSVLDNIFEEAFVGTKISEMTDDIVNFDIEPVKDGLMYNDDESQASTQVDAEGRTLSPLHFSSFANRIQPEVKRGYGCSEEGDPIPIPQLSSSLSTQIGVVRTTSSTPKGNQARKLSSNDQLATVASGHLPGHYFAFSALKAKGNPLVAGFPAHIPTRLSKLNIQEKESALDHGYELKSQDVLCGSSGCRWSKVVLRQHPGNERFRLIVDMHRERYSKATTRKAKTQLVKDVVNMVRESGANFVRKEGNTFFDIGDLKAREKAGHALRAASGRVNLP